MGAGRRPLPLGGARAGGGPRPRRGGWGLRELAAGAAAGGLLLFVLMSAAAWVLGRRQPTTKMMRALTAKRDAQRALERDNLCRAATTLRDDLALLVPRWRAGRVSGASAEVPGSVAAAWAVAEGHVPDAEQFRRLREAVPPGLHRTGQSVGEGGPAGGIDGEGGPLEGPGMEPWAVQFLQEDLAAFRKQLPAYPEGGYAGRGVVLTGGGVKHFGGAVVVFATLRKQGCTLPGELWVTAAERRDMPAAVVEALEAQLGAAVRVLPASKRGELGGYAAKTGALMLSSFQEVLFLDSDNVPVTDACALFETGEYKATGALLWPDFWPASPAPELRTITGVAELLNSTHETGQMVFDKQRAWRPLMVAAYFNMLGPGLYYKLFTDFVGEGDKETFPYAFLVEGLPEYTVPHPVSVAGSKWLNTTSGKEERFGYTMVQRWPSGEALFLHQNNHKTTFFNLPEVPREKGRPDKLVPWESKDDFNRAAGYNIELWVWNVLRAIRCDPSVVEAMLILRERILPNDWCWLWRVYMEDHPSNDTLVCPLH